MEASELLKKVRKIEIKTRGLSQNIFAGEYHSLFKGHGMAFSEVREYQYGDAIRDIDWNVTARLNKPYVKVFEEERELTVMLLIDLSGSQGLGSRARIKRETITEIAATLSFSAILNNDKIGVLLFSDKIEKLILPQKGRKHILRIIRELLEFQPESSGTDIPLALEYFTNMIKRRCTAFLISDFNDRHPMKDALSIANRKHDLVAIRVYDQLESKLPDIGLIRVSDVETGQEKWLDTSSKKVQQAFQDNYAERIIDLEDTFTKSGVEHVHIKSDEDYVKSLMTLFKKR
ncbi:MAG: DUF58 domain-containing protein [Bacteroidales bacterium]|nr:DUF58 domain-containing protein [Bacteroidales bacterium]